MLLITFGNNDVTTTERSVNQSLKTHHLINSTIYCFSPETSIAISPTPTPPARGAPEFVLPAGLLDALWFMRSSVVCFCTRLNSVCTCSRALSCAKLVCLLNEVPLCRNRSS